MGINILQLTLGFAGGLAVGAGFVAVLTMLGIIPRLVQLSRSIKSIKLYTAAVVLGTLAGTFLSFTTWTIKLPTLFLVIWGLFHGMFVGMVAAALTEVLNVYPIITKRIGLYDHLLFLIMAIVFGKIIGSLFQWLIFVK